jgi:cation diffusion facilitator family transporter
MPADSHQHDLSPFTHDHQFGSAGADARATALWQVTALTLAAMLLELAVGYWSGSLALTADGWHMGTHALALGGAALAMRLARRASKSSRFAFGGWKIEMLAAYSSALLLLTVSLSLVLQAVEHLRSPQPIAYEEAIGVALLGLLVNLLSAWLLAAPARASSPAADAPDRTAHGHDHGHAHSHEHSHGHLHQHDHGDHNFRAAWLHVLADLFTSVLALLALAGGLWLGWRWLDPAVAVVGAVVIARWAWSVLGVAARALVDASGDAQLSQQIRERMEADGDTRVADLHVWQVGPQAFSAALSVVADAPQPTAAYHQRLHGLPTLRHVTLEIHRCTQAVPTGH